MFQRRPIFFRSQDLRQIWIYDRKGLKRKCDKKHVIQQPDPRDKDMIIQIAWNQMMASMINECSIEFFCKSITKHPVKRNGSRIPFFVKIVYLNS